MKLKVALVLCWLAWLLNFSYRMMIPALMPAIKVELGLTELQASLMLSLLLVGHAISLSLSGFLASALGNERVIALSLLTVSITSIPASLLPLSPLWLSLDFFASGLGLGLYLPSALSLLSKLAPSSIKGRVMGVHETAAPLGQTLGPLMAGLALSVGFPWRLCILLWTLLPIALASIFLMQPKTESPSRLKVRSPVKIDVPVKVYALLLTTYLCMASGTGLIVMVPLYMSSFFGLSAALAAFIVGGSRITGVAGQLIGGFLSDKLGRVKVLFFTVVITAASTAILATAPYGPLFISSLLVVAASQTAFFPVFFALIADVFEEEVRGKILSLILAPGLAMGSGLTPYVIGWLAETYSYPAALLYPLTLSIASIPLVAVVKIALKSRLPSKP